MSFLFRLVRLVFVAVLFSSVAYIVANKIHKHRAEQLIASGEKMDSLAGNYLAGRFALNLGKYEESAKLYEVALNKFKTNPNLMEKTYELMIMAGRMPEGIELAKKHHAADDNALMPKIVLAMDYISKSDFLSATKILEPITVKAEKGRRIDLTNDIAVMLHSWALVATHGESLALNDLEAEAKLRKLPILYYHLAMVNELLGNKEAAKSIYDELVKESLPLTIANAAYHFYMRNGNDEDARKVLQHYHNENPDYVFLTEESEDSIEKLDRPTLTKKVLGNMMVEVANIFFSREYLEEAQLYYRLALHIDPQNNDALFLMSNVLEQKERFDEAAVLYDSIQPNSRYYWKARISRALLSDKQGNTEEAKLALLDMAAERPDEIEAYLNLGDLMIGKDRFAEAAEYYTNSIDRIKETLPAHWAIYYARGISYERQKIWDKAEADFKKSLELKPEQPDVMNYMAYSWLDQNKNLEEAEKLLRIAVEKRPEDSHILDSYGWAMFKLQRYEEAVIFLEKANLIDPVDTTTNEHLGDAYWKLGRKNESKFQWERALKGKPTAEQISILKQKLEVGLDASLAISKPAEEPAITSPAEEPKKDVKTN